MNTRSLTNEHMNCARTERAFRRIMLLVGGYLAISVLSLVAIVLLRNDSAVVNPAVWTRGTIVAVTSSLMFAFTVQAARGCRRAYLQVRIVSAIMLVAIAVIIALPGFFPLWMKIEQGICGLILIGVVALVNSQHLRRLFANKNIGA